MIRIPVTLAIVGVSLFEFVACDYKTGAGRKDVGGNKSQNLDHKAEIAHKDAKVFAAEAAKVAIVTKAEALVKAEVEKQAVEDTADKIRKVGEQTSEAVDQNTKETGKQK